MTTSRLSGRLIVLTRPNRGRLGDRLAGLGADVQHVPLIAICEARDGGSALSAALDDLDTYDWLVVTSANGADRVGPAAHRSTVRLAAVGAATASTLAEHAGRPVDLVPTVQRTAGLLDIFPRRRNRVLIAQGSLASGELVTGLRSLGCDVTAVEAYATVPRHPLRPELDALRRANAVVLASGSAAAAWVQAERSVTGGPELVTPHPAVVAIGPQTAAAARRLGIAVAAVSESPGIDDIVAAIVTALS